MDASREGSGLFRQQQGGDAQHLKMLGVVGLIYGPYTPQRHGITRPIDGPYTPKRHGRAWRHKTAALVLLVFEGLF